MSRRARNRPDKWAETLDLARAFGHGTPMPSEEDEDPNRWYWDEVPDSNNRTPSAQLDVRPQKHESRT